MGSRGRWAASGSIDSSCTTQTKINDVTTERSGSKTRGGEKRGNTTEGAIRDNLSEGKGGKPKGKGDIKREQRRGGGEPGV